MRQKIDLLDVVRLLAVSVGKRLLAASGERRCALPKAALASALAYGAGKKLSQKTPVKQAVAENTGQPLQKTPGNRRKKHRVAVTDAKNTGHSLEKHHTT